jgi:Flp pilus assembly protein TadG
MKLNRKSEKKPKHRGQAIVEFAIALPVLLLILLGIFEVGRYMFLYSSVTNASRNAVRYASAFGKSDSGYTKYNYCYGIYQSAKNSAFLVPVTTANMTIDYDLYDESAGTFTQGPYCDQWSSTQVDADVSVSSGDRVTVQVQVQYAPVLKLIPLQPRTITSTSSRTILGILSLDN